mmetsp:Transcript_7447/g.17027  ORF Transcript_7447/g.17027 Transcript_7447/m.17027 type:complete len:195 (-) Transcript_7447:1572-2156(-)
MASSKSWLTPVPDCTYEIKQLLREHSGRIRRKEPYNPQSGVLPLDYPTFERNNPSNPQTGAADVRAENTLSQCIEKPAPSKFSVVFRVLKTVPNVTNSLEALCKQGSARAKYHFVVRMKDDSGEIDAFVSDSSGAEMMGVSAKQAQDFKGEKAMEKHKAMCLSWWAGKVCSVTWKERKYFVLESVQSRNPDRSW